METNRISYSYSFKTSKDYQSKSVNISYSSDVQDGETPETAYKRIKDQVMEWSGDELNLPQTAVQSAQRAFPGATVSAPVNNYGNATSGYIFTFGKHKGKSIDQVGVEVAKGYLNWLRKSAQESNKPLSKSAKELEAALTPATDEIPF